VRQLKFTTKLTGPFECVIVGILHGHEQTKLQQHFYFCSSLTYLNFSEIRNCDDVVLSRNFFLLSSRSTVLRISSRVAHVRWALAFRHIARI